MNAMTLAADTTPKIEMSPAEFAELVKVGVDAGFDELRWSMAKGNITLKPQDFADTYLLLPLVAWAAMETWAILSTRLGGSFTAEFRKDEVMMIGVKLHKVIASSKRVAGMAAMAAIAGIDPVGDLDKLKDAFDRSGVKDAFSSSPSDE